MAWLVAGLGNPGDRYSRTRHNAGRMVVEELARGSGERFRKVRFLPAEIAEISVGGQRVLLVRSSRFMNESGPSYSSVAKKRGVAPGEFVAVHDELDIPLGDVRIKRGGGAGGHNGLKSLQHALGSGDFYRVRVGIGRPPGRQDPADFVTEPMGKAVESELADAVARACDAVQALIEHGPDAAWAKARQEAPGD
jgi:peptidyl-tRNA hydrolase, PTH1 family